MLRVCPLSSPRLQTFSPKLGKLPIDTGEQDVEAHVDRLLDRLESLVLGTGGPTQFAKIGNRLTQLTAVCGAAANGTPLNGYSPMISPLISPRAATSKRAQSPSGRRDSSCSNSSGVDDCCAIQSNVNSFAPEARHSRMNSGQIRGKMDELVQWVNHHAESQRGGTMEDEFDLTRLTEETCLHSSRSGGNPAQDLVQTLQTELAERNAQVVRLEGLLEESEAKVMRLREILTDIKTSETQSAKNTSKINSADDSKSSGGIVKRLQEQAAELAKRDVEVARLQSLVDNLQAVVEVVKDQIAMISAYCPTMVDMMFHDGATPHEEEVKSEVRQQAKLAAKNFPLTFLQGNAQPAKAYREAPTQWLAASAPTLTAATGSPFISSGCRSPDSPMLLRTAVRQDATPLLEHRSPLLEHRSPLMVCRSISAYSVNMPPQAVLGPAFAPLATGSTGSVAFPYRSTS